MPEPKPVTAEYIESGTFQAGEEDCYEAGIWTGEEVVILKKREYENLNSKAWQYDQLCK